MRRPTRILTIVAAAPLTVLALAACTPTGALPLLTSTATPTPTSTATPGLAATRIANLAAKSVDDGTVVSVASESDGSLWVVRVVADDGSEQEVHLDRTGRVVSGPSADTTDADEASDNRASVAAIDVGLAAAAKKMTSAVPGGRITAIELDDYEDRVVWQGDVTDTSGVRHDVRIDAVNGAVVLNQADARPSPAPTSGS